MDVKSRREEYAETTRTAIVEAAIAQFTADGFARSSIDAVAESARVTKGAVYHHFKDKADLFEAAFVVMEERLLARVRFSSAQIARWNPDPPGVGRNGGSHIIDLRFPKAPLGAHHYVPHGER